MALAVHVAEPVPDRVDDLSPLVYSRRSRSLYVGLSAGRGGHHRVHNLMQRRSALTPASARDPHGWYRPDGRFEWDEHFPVPDAIEEADVRRAIEALVDPGRPAPPPAGRLAVRLRRPLRPLRAVAQAVPTLRARPRRPPVDPPAQIEELSRVEPHREFITPNGFASACRYVLRDGSLVVNEEVDNDWWFCKSDWLEHFFRHVAPDSPFVLFSSDSDRPIDRGFRRHLRRAALVTWFAVNVTLRHRKLFAIPLGLGDSSARHGDAEADVLATQRSHVPKRRLLDVSFNVRTNPGERLRCLAETRLELDPPLPKLAYLERLASSYFCVAPEGNGIDTHRIWEALYLRTVPVVTRSVLVDQHPDLPLVVVDNWSDFRAIDFSPELYARTLARWTPEEISRDRYLERVAGTIERLRASAQPAKEPA